MRLIVAEDSVLLRDGLVRLFTAAGHDVVATAADTAELDDVAGLAAPAGPAAEPPADVAVLDIRMPPTHTDEGARAALRLRERHPDIGILLLSQHIEARHALRLMREHPRGFGYLLKDRVLDVDDLLAAVGRVAAGGFAVDPDVVSQLLTRSQVRGALARLTPRETDVLRLVAQGGSNAAVGRALRMSGKTVENHVSSVFAKLGLADDPDEHRRIRAVLIYLDGRTG